MSGQECLHLHAREDVPNVIREATDLISEMDTKQFPRVKQDRQKSRSLVVMYTIRTLVTKRVHEIACKFIKNSHFKHQRMLTEPAAIRQGQLHDELQQISYPLLAQQAIDRQALGGDAVPVHVGGGKSSLLGTKIFSDR